MNASYKFRVTSGWEHRVRLNLFFWFGLAAFALLVTGYLIASNPFVLGMLVVGLAWLVLLPYHTPIAACVAVATFGSALIVPLFPGRPYWWEFAALLAWTGMLVTLSLRRYEPGFWGNLRRHWVLFAGILGYCAVLLVTMAVHGVGLRILGTDQMGGRSYIQQLSCAIFPVLFLAFRMDAKLITRLFMLQLLLSATYLVSDFVFSFAPQELFVLLQFFELPGDALNFEMQNMRFGVRRFQSLAIVGQALIFALMLRFHLRDFLGVRGFVLLPLALGIMSLGLASGHRMMLVIVGLTVAFCAFTQKFLTVKNALVTLCLAVLTLVAAYQFARETPLAVQRALSVLPGIDIDNQSLSDGAGTMETRRTLRQVGWQLVPQYLWLGRGFGMSSAVDFSSLWDPTGVTSHVNTGKFYNGPIGLLVNTGLFGTLFMFVFLGASTWIAVRMMFRLRRIGCDDTFTRMCSVLTGLWMANVVVFIFLHGDSEHALKSFALQAGLLMVCNIQLEKVRRGRADSPAASTRWAESGGDTLPESAGERSA
ncbi:MAG: hypothetical protein HZA89_15165 [Verrucomicrobia bacterium]|nr:hypothetical protein [Verrucomicrobiota bacterium]